MKHLIYGRTARGKLRCLQVKPSPKWGKIRQNLTKSGKIIDFGVRYNSPKSSKLWRYRMFNILFSHCYGPWKYHFLIAMNPFVTNVLDFDVTSCEVKDKSVTARKNVTKPGKWAEVFNAQGVFESGISFRGGKWILNASEWAIFVDFQEFPYCCPGHFKCLTP